jgi:hypothetical protein
MNNSISADDIGVEASQQQPFAPGIRTVTRSLDSPKMAERGSGRPADASRTRRDRPKAAVSWYGKLLIVSMLLVGAAWEVFKWIITVITLD